MKKNIFIHPTADVDKKSKIGEGTKIWHQAQIREGTIIGKNCIISKNVYIDHDIIIENNVKIQNNVSIYYETIIEDGVFIGPHVCFTNDKTPRSINPNGSLKSSGIKGTDWKICKIHIKKGASIGANSTILPDITIGNWSLIGAGSVVTKNVPNHGLVYGNPAKLKGFVCKCGKKIKYISEDNKFAYMECLDCKIKIKIPIKIYKVLEK